MRTGSRSSFRLRSFHRRSSRSTRCRVGSSPSPSTTRSRPWSTLRVLSFSAPRRATTSGWPSSGQSRSSPYSPHSRRGGTGASSRASGLLQNHPSGGGATRSRNDDSLQERQGDSAADLLGSEKQASHEGGFRRRAALFFCRL